jgi:hypothetical protein
MTASLCLSERGEYGCVLQMERARTVAVIHVQAPMVTVNVPEDRRYLRQGCQVFEALMGSGNPICQFRVLNPEAELSKNIKKDSILTGIDRILDVKLGYT